LKGRQLANSHIEGRVVWITGAGSGIGRACALAFAEVGARLALSGRTVEKLRETAALTGAPDDILQVPGDIAAEQDIARMHAEIVGRLGDPDILVNNAASNIGRRHWRDIRPEGAAELIHLLVSAPFQTSLAVLPAMRRKGQGTLIQIASLAGVMTHLPSGPAYMAGKHALVAMSDNLNAEEGIHGIRSVCICPGEVETPILDKRPAPPDAAQRALMLQPEDIAAAAVFCAGLPPRASVTRLVIQPTDESVYRNAAKFIEALPEPS
jgi:NAD(P)-dependent dehydrogenase (short-subunit alcohol dehydrogenase family)